MDYSPNDDPLTGSRGWRDVCQHVMDYCSDGVIVADSRGHVVRVNRRVCELFGCSRHELVGRRSIDLVTNEDRIRLANELSRLKEGGELLAVISVSTMDGEQVPVELSGRSVCERETGELFFVGLLQDLRTRRAEEQTQLRRADKQRNAIVREVHHRIKNHLQGLLGLISREAARNPEGASLFHDVSTKINSIAVVHGLQASQQRDAINLCDLVATVASLNAEIRGASGGVTTSLEIAEPALIRETECVPVALLMNEAISNAIKHSGTRSEAVLITVSGDGRQGHATVTIRNSGSLPSGFDDSTLSGISSGLGLVQALLPAQGARFHIGSDEGSDEVVTEVAFESPVIIDRGIQS